MYCISTLRMPCKDTISFEEGIYLPIELMFITMEEKAEIQEVLFLYSLNNI